MLVAQTLFEMRAATPRAAPSPTWCREVGREFYYYADASAFGGGTPPADDGSSFLATGAGGDSRWVWIGQVIELGLGAGVTSFNGRSGAVVPTAGDYSKADVGLGSVDNTSDANKPVSTYQQSAIDAKVGDAIVDGVTTVAPSQNAVFAALAGKQAALGFTPENTANKSIDTSLGSSDTLFPTQKAVKDHIDGRILNEITSYSSGNWPNEYATHNALDAKINTSAKDAASGVVGKTGADINFYDSTGTHKSILTNSATTPRTYTFQNADGTVAFLGDKLSAFASTTSAELRGVISDETGSGALVFADSPVFAGTPSLPSGTTGTTQSASDSSTKLATTQFVHDVVVAPSSTFTTPTFAVDSATANAAETAATVRKTTSGTPANGIGASLDFEVETSASNNEIGARLQAIATDTTGGSEDFALDLLLMKAGAAASKVIRFSSVGELLPVNIHNNGGTGNASNQAIASGTYTPSTSGASANVSGAITVYEVGWTRVGNEVIVGLMFRCAHVAAGTVTTIDFSLPIATSFPGSPAGGEASGCMVFNSVGGGGGVVTPKASSALVTFTYTPSATGARTTVGSFRYTII